MFAIVRGAILVAAAGLAAGCSEPTKPTPIDPGAPTLSCPAAPNAVQAADSAGAIVVFGAASANGGAPPLATPTCTASSGSKFPVGTTTVTCTVSDAKARSSAPCSFSVVVTPPLRPTLSVTRFLAFGDSMTAGEVVSEGDGPAVCPDAVSTTSAQFRPFRINPAEAWPAQLQPLLEHQYSTQTFVMQDYGCSGETTAAGFARLPRIVPATQPQIVLLLEGANDINGGASAINAAVSNLELMVDYVKSRNLKVVVATLPPQNGSLDPNTNCSYRNGGYGYVESFNVGLTAMAARENIPVAQIFQAFNGDVTTLIDCDGLHPTPAGYKVMAQAFDDAVTKNFEAPPTTTAAPFFSPRVDRTHRR